MAASAVAQQVKKAIRQSVADTVRNLPSSEIQNQCNFSFSYIPKDEKI